MLRRSRQDKSLDEWRRRLIRETEDALLFGLTHPKQSPRIPTVEVGHGAFKPAFADQWWSAVLDLKP